MAVRKEDLLRFLQGHVAAARVIEAEQARRLPDLTARESLAEYEDLCQVWYRVPRAPEVDPDHLVTPQFEAAWKLHEALTTLSYRYALIGGLAVQFWGQPRFTRDVDVTVLVDPGQEGALAAALVERFSPRLPDAVEFALANRVLLRRVGGL